MSFQRLRRVLGLELSYTLRRPMILMLVAVLALLAFGMAGGNVRMSTGDASVGGTKAWITSEFSNAFVLSMVICTLYSFFAAIAAGMSLISDDETKVGEILHTTPLRPSEYVWGKAAAYFIAFTLVLGVHLALMAFFNHFRPSANADEIRGPFELLNYLRPALIFGLPPLFFFTGVAFYLGERFRRPALIFLFPVGAVLLMGFFLWTWVPTWLDPRINQLLMLVDPGGFRWLDQTWIRLDRGADFYNHARIGVDPLFAASRFVFVALGLGAVALAQRHLARTLGGRAEKPVAPARVREILAAPQAAPVTDAVSAGPLVTQTRPAGFLAATVHTLRTETGALLREPGLYLFGFFIVLQTLGSNLLALGPFETPLLLTSGQIAVSSANTLVLLVGLLMMFYVGASLERERDTGVDALTYSSPTPTSALLLGKILGNAVVAGVVMLAILLGGLIALAIQGKVPISLWPFALVWVALLGPTFLAWGAFIAFVFSATGNRYATYAIGIGVIAFSLYRQFTDGMSWVGNWWLWDALHWSDISVFELDRRSLLLNRATVLAAGVLCFVLALRLFPRRRYDANRILHRLYPRSLARTSGLLAPWAAPTLALGVVLFLSVTHGPEGKAAEKKAEDYWKQNLATWNDAPAPAIREVVLDLDLDPAAGTFHSRGSYVLENPYDHELRSFAVTGGRHWQDVSWTLEGQAFEPEDKTRLFVFTPPSPMAPGDRLKVGFDFHGSVPDGPSKNGGSAQEFIVPSGVVLTSFTASFVPVLGFVDTIGVDDDNRYEPKIYPDDHYHEVLPPLFGNQYDFTTRVKVTVPEDFRANSVGVLENDEITGGKRTMTWVSDQPVRFFNVVAGRWAERRGEGTAIYYDPAHAYNIDEMSRALDAARRYYSEWFYPYPWKELKLSEFPALATYAQGFPTNITFSEGIGFLTKSDEKSRLATMVTAHESAHQWWANILTPGKGPGGNILSEGMSHFSTALLLEQLEGEQGRMAFLKRIEERYGDRRRKDAERPLVKIDGSHQGDTTVTYDRGGWVAWMLMQQMGRERMLEGLRSFIVAFKDGPDYPMVEDLVDHLRPYSEDPVAYDAFVQQWIFGTVVPEYRLHDAEVETEGGVWHATVEVENAGTGRMPVEVAAVRGERFADDGSAGADYHDARTTVVLDAGEKRQVEITADFEPEKLVVDPDVTILQLQRKTALIRL